MKKEPAEWRWVFDYMASNANQEIYKEIEFALESTQRNHEVVEEIIWHLLRHEPGRDFIKRLRNSLRQHRYRSSQKRKEISTFALPTKTKENLRRVARQLKLSESELIAEALSNGEKLVETHRQQIQQINKTHELRYKKAKNDIDILKVKHHEAMRQIQVLAKRISIWELALETELPDIIVDQGVLDETTKKKTRAVKAAIKAEVDKWRLVSGAP
tara:strand:+ start:585 stop:1229 length:645 start_codon:yes stop_codon:yes gene_type:complete